MSIAAGPDAVDSGIILVYDAANRNCYPGSGSSITDISNNGYVGTLLNSVGFSTANQGVLTFNGTNQQITNGFKPSGARSCFIWVKYNKITGLPNGYSISGTQEINAYNYIGIQDGGTFYYYAGTTGGNLASVFLKSGNWYQQGFALNSDGSRTLYLNGVSVGSEAGGVGSTATVTFSVGCINSNYWVDGQIGMVQQFNRSLTTSEVLQNYNATKARFTPSDLVTKGLILNYDVGNNSSYAGTGTTLTDISGWGINNGTLTNGPTYSSNNSGFLTFDGTNDFVSTSFTPPNIFSTSFWFNNTSTYNINNRGIFSTYASGNFNGVYVGTTTLAAGGLRIFYNGNGNTVLSYTFAINTWYNISITSSGSEILIYVNGALVNTISSATSHSDVLLLAQTRFDSNYWIGNISAFAVYNRVLTQDEVTQNFNALRWRYNI